MENPQFRRNLILIAGLHILLIAGILYFAKRETQKPQGDITWVNPGSFATAPSSAPELAEEEEPEPAPESKDTPEPTPEPTTKGFEFLLDGGQPSEESSDSPWKAVSDDAAQDAPDDDQLNDFFKGLK